MEAADLKEAMQHWYRREANVFGPGCADKRSPTMPGKTLDSEDAGVMPRLSSSRIASVKLARLLLNEYGALPELPAVLNLLSSLIAKVEKSTSGATRGLAFRLGSSPSEASAFTSTLAAVVRVAAKTKLAGYYLGKTRMAESTASARLQGLGMPTLSAESIDALELSILINYMDCIGLPTPVDWARASLALLDHQGTDPTLRQVLFHVMPCVDEWAQFLSVEFGASTDLPPSWLALAACTLGLVSKGVMRPDAMWPKGLPTSAWESSVLHRMDKAISARPQAAAPPAKVDAEQLSAAMGCEQQEAARRVFAVLLRLSEGAGAGGAAAATRRPSQSEDVAEVSERSGDCCREAREASARCQGVESPAFVDGAAGVELPR